MEMKPNWSEGNNMYAGFVQQGWQCPVCGKVHAPWVSECDCYKAEWKINTVKGSDPLGQLGDTNITFTHTDYLNRS